MASRQQIDLAFQERDEALARATVYVAAPVGSETSDLLDHDPFSIRGGTAHPD